MDKYYVLFPLGLGRRQLRITLELNVSFTQLKCRAIYLYIHWRSHKLAVIVVSGKSVIYIAVTVGVNV